MPLWWVYVPHHRNISDFAVCLIYLGLKTVVGAAFIFFILIMDICIVKETFVLLSTLHVSLLFNSLIASPLDTYVFANRFRTVQFKRITS